MTTSGALVLVVGPSGAGKDTLMAAARAQLSDDPRFFFVRRMVTRVAVPGVEDHATLSPEDFAAGRAKEAFALSWEAHGLGYALPKSIDVEIAAERTVVANGSRKVIGEALVRYPGCRVLLIDADPAVRAARLAGRGRETEAEIAARLVRDGAELPADANIRVIDNSGALAASVGAFVLALLQIAG